MAKRTGSIPVASMPPKNQRVSPARISKASTNSAARGTVLGTVELVEHIILQLPSTAVFRSQRVCRQFRNIIAASPAVQQKLGLQTKAQHERWVKPVAANPGIMIRIGPESDRKDFTIVPTYVSDLLLRCERPSAFLSCTPYQEDAASFSPWKFPDRFCRGEVMDTHRSLNNAMVRMLFYPSTKVPCSGMQLTNASAVKGMVWLSWSVDRSSGFARANIKVATGITVRDVVNAIREPNAHYIWDEGAMYKHEDAIQGLDGVVEGMGRKYGSFARVSFDKILLAGAVMPSEEESDMYMSSVHKDST